MKKLIIYLAILSFLNLLVGCYSSPVVNPDDYIETDSWTQQRIAGARVIINLKNGSILHGELLTVRDSTMLICEQYEASEVDLSNSVFQINIISNYNIDLMIVQGDSKIAEGIAIGVGAGVAVGIAIGLASGDDPNAGAKGFTGFLQFTAGAKAGILGCGLGLVGIVIGFIAGSFSSTYDKEVFNYAIPEDYDFTQLNIFSRYVGNEPAYLKAIK